MTTNIRYAQLQSFVLSGAGVAIGNATIVLNSFTDIDGNLLDMTDFGSIGFATIEPDNLTREEQISFSGVTQNINGTATLTGIKNVSFLSPYTQTSGLFKSHPGGAKLVISNTSGFYDEFVSKKNDETLEGIITFTEPYVPRLDSSHTYGAGEDLYLATKEYADGISTAGAPNMSLTAKGIAQEASQADIDSGTQVGTTGAELAVNPKYLQDSIYYTQLPTSDEKDALAGSYGVPSSSNKYVTATDRFGGLMPSGTITMFGGASAPSGWLLCDGTSVLQATYADLFAVIGTTYGSADGTHFNVPDMRGRAPIGVGTGIGGGASGTGLPTGGSALTARVRGAWLGEQTHTQTTDEMPSHYHSNVQSKSGGSEVNGANMGLSNGNTSSVGGGNPFNVIQPVMTVNFIIKT